MSSDRPEPAAIPTLEHVAVVAGVSRATVSRVINGVRNVDPQLQEVVRAAVEQTGYVPNHAARALVTRRTNSVALVVSEGEHRAFDASDTPFVGRIFTDPYFGRLVAGLFSALRPAAYSLTLMLAETDEIRRQLVGYLRQGHVDGVILMSSHPQDPLPRILAETALPLVLTERPSIPLRATYVDVAQSAGAALAADHLVARGCKSVATVSGPLDMGAARDRLSGFRDRMARHGHPYIPSVEANFTRETGRLATERLLAQNPALDGIFAANDLMALGAVLALHEHGKRIPQDVAVVGFDDSNVALASRPSLTTVRQPVEEMAAEMARMLLAHIGQPGRPASSVIFEPTLVVRESA
jgi:DNA-binding LacI/PurR family transcriptional regulator